MAEKFTIACGQGGIVCGAKVSGETEDETLEKAVEHAREKHGVDLTQSRTLTRYARSLLREA